MNVPPAPSERETRALIAALGLDLDRLQGPLRAAIEALAEEVIAQRQDAECLRARLAEVELLADHDTLCPVFNRRAFEREVRREIALAGRFGTPLSLIFVDLDNFKAVNDGFGHVAGDAVLVRVAGILLARTRETDIVGRLGGDEFGVLLAHANLGDSRNKAGELALAIDALEVRGKDPEAGSVRIGASCGIAEWQPGQDAATFIAAADREMFAEKMRRRASGRPGR